MYNEAPHDQRKYIKYTVFYFVFRLSSNSQRLRREPSAFLLLSDPVTVTTWNSAAAKDEEEETSNNGSIGELLSLHVNVEALAAVLSS